MTGHRDGRPQGAGRRIGAALASAVLLMLVGTPTAQAAGTTTSWKSTAVTCIQSFGFTSTSVTGTAATGATVTLSGTIQPCARTPAGAKDYFGIGRYEWVPLGDLGQARNVVALTPTYYSSPTGVTSFRIPITVGSSSPALCLAPGPTVRLTCVDVSWSNGLPVVTPLSTKDPKVAATLPDPWSLQYPAPKCGGCWGS